MLRGDWSKRPETIAAAKFCILAAFGAFFLLYILGVLNGREAERRDQTPANYSQSAKADAQRACVGMEARAAFECVYEKVEASQEQASTEQDLSAQQRAATSALASAVVAALTLVISIVGVWYVKRTLDATLEAVQDTGKATIAMNDANEIANKAISLQRQNTIVDQRPWLSVEVNKIYDIFFDNDVGSLRLAYILIVKNSGKTPALFTTSYVMFTDKDENGKLNFSKFVSKACELLPFRSSAIAPGNQEVFMSVNSLIGTPPIDPTKIVPEIFVGVIYQGIEGSRIYYSVHQVTISMRDIGKGVKSSPPYFMLKSFMT